MTALSEAAMREAVLPAFRGQGLPILAPTPGLRPLCPPFLAPPPPRSGGVCVTDPLVGGHGNPVRGQGGERQVRLSPQPAFFC